MTPLGLSLLVHGFGNGIAGEPLKPSLPVLLEQPGEPLPYFPLGLRTAELELMNLMVVP